MRNYFRSVLCGVLVASIMLTLIPVNVLALELSNVTIEESPTGTFADIGYSDTNENELHDITENERPEEETQEIFDGTSESMQAENGSVVDNVEYQVEIKTYDGDETLASLSVTPNFIMSKNDIDALVSPDDLLRENFSFVGWSTDMGEVETTYSCPEYFEIQGNTVIYAVYCALQNTQVDDIEREELSDPLDDSELLNSPFEEMNALIAEALYVKRNTPAAVIEDEDSEELNNIRNRIETACDIFEEMSALAPQAISTLSDEDPDITPEEPNITFNFSGGSGVEGDPFIISTANDLLEVREVIDNGTAAFYKLEDDISLQGISWTPIGTSSTPFMGHFDGNGCEIINLNIQSTDSRVGLFGVANNATVENLTIQNATVVGGSIVGTLFGQGLNCTVSNITLKNCIVTGGSFVGGVFGSCTTSTVTNCVNDGSVRASGSYTGGIVGLFDGSIERALFTGTVNAQDWVGGIAGTIYGHAYYCTNTGSISGTKTVGGIAGELSYSQNAREVNYCYNTGSIKGGTEVGGIAGYSLSSRNYSTGARITGAANTGAVQSSGSYAGGIIGDSASSTFIVTSYNTGNITGEAPIGGIAGRYNFKNEYYVSGVSGVYNAGKVPLKGGGLIGTSYATLVTNSFYRKDESETTVGINYNHTENRCEISPKTTSELRKMASTLHSTRFAKDENLINGGFPYLVDIDYSRGKDPRHGQFKFAGFYSGFDIVSDYYYDDEYFSQSSYIYNEHLATMSLSLAMSAFKSTEASVVKEEVEANDGLNDNSKVGGDVNVEKLLGNLGFTEYTQLNYDKQTRSDSIGVATAHKVIEINNEQVSVIAVAIRGAGYGAEWAGNLTIGKAGHHKGFSTARDEVLAHLQDYFANHTVATEKVKFWVTGFSRAAATANLVAAALDDGALSIPGHTYATEDVYAYTFETPRGALGSATENVKYYNIFNIINDNDPVPKVAPEVWGFGWYGMKKSIPTRTAFGENYWEYLEKMLDQYENMNFPVVGDAEYAVDKISLFEFINDLDNYLAGNSDFPVGIKIGDDMAQDEFLDYAVESLAQDLLKNREYYADYFQEPTRRIALALFSSGDNNGAVKALLLDLAEHSKELALIFGEIIPNLNETEIDEVITELIKAGATPIIKEVVTNWLTKNGWEELSDEEIDAVVSDLEAILRDCFRNHQAEILTFLSNVKRILQAHVPEVCFAWVRSMDSYFTMDEEHAGVPVVQISVS